MRLQVYLFSILLVLVSWGTLPAQDLSLKLDLSHYETANPFPQSSQQTIRLAAVEPSMPGQQSHWRRAPYAVGATLLVYPFDVPIQQWVQANRTPQGDRLARFARQFGEPKTYFPYMVGFYLYGQLAGDKRARRTAELAAESMIITGLTTQILKYTFRRPRPGNVEADEPFEADGGRLSFPSGHSSLSFSMATVIAHQYEDLRPLAYGLASLTAWSRVNNNAHWTSDVIFGAYVGYASAKTAMEIDPD